MDYNSKGEMRMRFEDESPWNDQKEVDHMRIVKWLSRSDSYEYKWFMQDLRNLTFSFPNLVDRAVLPEISDGNQEALWIAANKIHDRSLDSSQPRVDLDKVLRNKKIIRQRKGVWTRK